MRLICPNCNAQYEVPVDVIPETGRDVQCSNCGHTWFQHHPDHAPEPEDADDLPEVDFDADLDAAEDAFAAEDDAPPPQAKGPEEPPTARRRSLDPSVAEVLREEAAREAQARRADGGGLESQPELGLDSAMETAEERRARQARERTTRMRSAAPGETTTPSDPADTEDPDNAPEAVPPQAERAASASSRSEMLPDIDEINQTLRAATDRRPAETPEGRAPAADPDTQSGFSRGLSIGILIVVLAVALYIFAAPIAESVPALAPFLETYVAQANDLRVWLQTTLEGLGAMVGGTSDAAG